MSILSFLAVLYILSDRTNPSYKLAWVIPILAFPIFGGILYIMFGGNKLSKRQKAQLQTVDEITRSNLKQDPLVLHALQQQNLLAASQAQYLIHCASSPVFQNTESTYYASGESCFPVMLQELRRASAIFSSNTSSLKTARCGRPFWRFSGKKPQLVWMCG